jgi:bifunctional UDP-N-acetylglucosamine pyrophosphorylase/glucosamine-1-phosphate N-acetyltransferase
MLDPGQTFIDVTVELGRDVTLFPGTILQGRTVIGQGCEIGPDTRLVDSVVGPGSVVENTIARDAEIGERARVGPFAVLSPGSVVASGTATGAFYTG